MTPLRVRSMVGLIPLLAVETIDPELLDAAPAFKKRLEWFLEHRPDLASLVSRWQEPGVGDVRLLALARGHRMKRLLKRMLDPEEFLSDYGVLAITRTCCRSMAPSTASRTSRRNRRRDCSAATPTGAGRCGSR
jgi:DNA-directed RNA polymerase subunit N (RpoN/RPB10)